MFWLPESIKRIGQNQPRQRGDTIFPLKVYGGIFRRTRAANSVVRYSRNSNSFNVTSKFKKIGSISNQKTWTFILRHSRAAIAVVSGGTWSKFELTQALIYVCCRYQQVCDGTNQTRRLHSPFYVYGYFS